MVGTNLKFTISFFKRCNGSLIDTVAVIVCHVDILVPEGKTSDDAESGEGLILRFRCRFRLRNRGIQINNLIADRPEIVTVCIEGKIGIIDIGVRISQCFISNLCGIQLHYHLLTLCYNSMEVGLAVLGSVKVSFILAPAIFPRSICTHFEIILASDRNDSLVDAVAVIVCHGSIFAPFIKASDDAEGVVGRTAKVIIVGCGRGYCCHRHRADHRTGQQYGQQLFCNCVLHCVILLL